MTLVDELLAGPPALFEVDPVTTPSGGVKLSADRRRTQRQAALLAAGWHPLSTVVSKPIRLHPDAAPVGDRAAPGLRCGGCVHRVVVGWHSRSYPKCAFGARGRRYLDEAPRASHGAATDCRAWWPGCVDHQVARGGDA